MDVCALNLLNVLKEIVREKDNVMHVKKKENLLLVFKIKKKHQDAKKMEKFP